MRRFFKKTKHGSIWIRIDEKEKDHFIIDVSSSSFFVTKGLENDFKKVLGNYLTYVTTVNDYYQKGVDHE